MEDMFEHHDEGADGDRLKKATTCLLEELDMESSAVGKAD
jgi:hypothetical protein